MSRSRRASPLDLRAPGEVSDNRDIHHEKNNAADAAVADDRDNLKWHERHHRDDDEPRRPPFAEVQHPAFKQRKRAIQAQRDARKRNVMRRRKTSQRVGDM